MKKFRIGQEVMFKRQGKTWSGRIVQRYRKHGVSRLTVAVKAFEFELYLDEIL